jgi:anti-anti-sigma factor
MTKDIEVTIDTRGEVSLIRIKGDVTAITGEAIENAYSEVSAAGTKKILICFDPESYINSGGIAILIGITAESRKREQVIRMAGLSDHFQKIFSMVGLTTYAELFPSEEVALEDF